MHPRKKQAVIDMLVYIAMHTSDVSSHGSSSQPKMVLGIENGFICLTGEALSKYQAVCDTLDDKTLWTVKISRDYIVKGVHALLGRIIKDGNTDTIEAHLDAFMMECEHVAEEVTVYLPIDNLRLDYDYLEFGEITLTTMRNKQLEELLQRFTAAIPDQEERETFLVHWRRNALPVIANRVVAIYTITAEPTRTHELAEAEWYRFLDILRYFIFLAFQKKVNIDVGLRGDVRFGVGEAVLLPSSYRTFQSLHSVKSPQSLIVGPEIIEAMEQQGVFALAGMLTSGQETAFSDTLFTGIHWVANALIQTEPANEYLSLVSCLETFLTRERGDLGSITNVVSTGVGWVLGRDQADRLALHKEVKKLYSERSTISHGGNQKGIESQLPRLRDIVGAFIQQMVQRRDEFRESGKQGLFEWIDQGPLRPAPQPDSDSRV